MPLTRLTLEERIRVVRFYSKYEKASSIQIAWMNEFGTDPPTRKTITAVNKKFDETGSVADLTRTGRPKTSRTEEKVALVQNALKNDPTKSIRILSNELGVNKASVHRIKQDSNKNGFLKQENKKLKDKVNQLQRRLDILEGKKPATKNPTRRDEANNIFILRDIKTEEPNISSVPFIFSSATDIEDSEPISKYEVLRMEDGNGQHLSLEHGTHSTVITVVADPESGHHAFELNEGDEVHHLTIDANGLLQEVDHDEETEVNLDGDEVVEVVMEDEDLIGNDDHDVESTTAITGDILFEEDEGLEKDHQIVVLGESERNITVEQEILEGEVEEETVEEEMVDCSIEMPICFITTTSGS